VRPDPSSIFQEAQSAVVFDGVRMDELPRKRILGAIVIAIGHSRYSEPTWIVEGIGPARFRSHYIVLDSGLVLDLFTAEITVSDGTQLEMEGMTDGIPIREIIGRKVTALVRDDTSSALIILDQSLFLKDANDAFYGNPLHAGYLGDEYTTEELSHFVDYWTEEQMGE
jgi:hypothetical protein